MDIQLALELAKQVLKALGIKLPPLKMPTKLKFDSFDEHVWLTQSEREKLLQLHPLVAYKASRTLIACKKAGLNVSIYMGLRSWATQQALYEKGRAYKNGKWVVVDKKKVVTNAKAGRSWHNYALAVDLVFKTQSDRWTWAESCPWEQMGEIGEKYGLEWGGRWTNFVDSPHLQYCKGLKDVGEAQALYKSKGMQAVWERVSI